MDDELQRLCDLLDITRKRIHEFEREMEELDLRRTESFSDYLEADKLFKEKGKTLEIMRGEVVDIRKSIDSLLGP